MGPGQVYSKKGKSHFLKRGRTGRVGVNNQKGNIRTFFLHTKKIEHHELIIFEVALLKKRERLIHIDKYVGKKIPIDG